MKAAPEPAPDRRALRQHLEAAGIGPGRGDPELVPYEPAFRRGPRHRRRHFRVEFGGRPACHLIVGPALDGVNQRAAAFHRDCPDLVCPPLAYWNDSAAGDCLCLEHFDGESLDSLVERSGCSATDWLRHVRAAQAALDRSQAGSATEARRDELAELVAAAGGFPGFSDVDRGILADIVSAVPDAPAGAGSLTSRWTNGDFAGRNLLVDAKGRLRLIDYEYARRTHFGAVDWLRLAQFSKLPPDLPPAEIEELRAAREHGLEVVFWLHHLTQLVQLAGGRERDRQLTATVAQLLAALHRAGSATPAGRPASRLLRSVALHATEAGALAAERTEWGRTLDRDLRAAHTALADAAQRAQETVDWARSLEAELRGAQAGHAELTQTFAQHRELAQALEKELAHARAEHARLAAEDERRAAWAKELEAEMQSARTAHAELVRTFEQHRKLAATVEQELARARAAHSRLAAEDERRAAWAGRLEQEMRSAQKAYAELRTEDERRAAWAKRMEAEMHALQAAHAQAVAQLEERTAWARSLEAELAARTSQVAELAGDNTRLQGLLEDAVDHARERAELERQRLEFERDRAEWAARLRDETAAVRAAAARAETAQREADRLATELAHAHRRLNEVLATLDAARAKGPLA